MKATMQNTLWSKIKRRVYPNHAKKSLRINLYSEIFEIVFYDITHLKCVQKKLTEM